MKRKKRASDGAWKKGQAGWLYKDIELQNAMYLSLGPPGIVHSGWRLIRHYASRYGRQGYHAMTEFGNPRMTVEEAKKHVERNYDKLDQILKSSFEHWELRQQRKAEAKAETK